MKITVRAGVQQLSAEIYDMASDANRAMLLYDLGVQEGFEREQYDDGDGTFYVLVTADSERILPLLSPIVESGVAPYYCEWNPACAGGRSGAGRNADEVWQAHGSDGSGVIYELEEA